MPVIAFVQRRRRRRRPHLLLQVYPRAVGQVGNVRTMTTITGEALAEATDPFQRQRRDIVPHRNVWPHRIDPVDPVDAALVRAVFPRQKVVHPFQLVRRAHLVRSVRLPSAARLARIRVGRIVVRRDALAGRGNGNRCRRCRRGR